MATHYRGLSVTAFHYLVCALWSSTDMDTDEPLDRNYSIADCSPELLKQAQEDCDAFMLEAEAIVESEGMEMEDYEQFGHDFWLSRNGHGAGFFDRGNDPVWDKLQATAKVWGSVDLYVGDDGMIHSN